MRNGQLSSRGLRSCSWALDRWSPRVWSHMSIRTLSARDVSNCFPPWPPPRARSAPRVPSGARRGVLASPHLRPRPALNWRGRSPPRIWLVPLSPLLQYLVRIPWLRGCVVRLLLQNHFPCRRHPNPNLFLFSICRAAEYVCCGWFFSRLLLRVSVRCFLALHPREARSLQLQRLLDVEWSHGIRWRIR